MADHEPTAEHTAQVRIQLATRHADISLAQDPGPILVPTNFRRYTLSTLVNNLLQTSRPVPLDFLVGGQLLRGTLADALAARGLSAEATLPVEYVRALAPPTHAASFVHDDWVGGVDVLSDASPAAAAAAGEDAAVTPGQERILSACYDGRLRVWTPSGAVEAVSKGGHRAAAKSARFISPSSIASAGVDRTVRVWDYAPTSTPDLDGGEDALTSNALRPVLELYGHTASVDRIAVHPPTSRILSASSDCRVGLWTASPTSSPAAPSSLLPTPTPKRRKLSTTTPLANTDTPKRGPLALLAAHTAPVSAALFAPHDPSVAYSASWDRALRTWDLATAAPVTTHPTSHPLLSLAALPTPNLLLAGTAARHVVGVDPRVSSGGGGGSARVAAVTLRGHSNAVVDVAAQPGNPWGAVTAGHDGDVRVWDVRSVKTGEGGAEGGSVFVVEREGRRRDGKGRKVVGGEGVKVFGVAWDARVGIVSGGEDCRVQIHRGAEGSG